MASVRSTYRLSSTNARFSLPRSLHSEPACFSYFWRFFTAAAAGDLMFQRKQRMIVVNNTKSATRRVCTRLSAELSWWYIQDKSSAQMVPCATRQRRASIMTREKHARYIRSLHYDRI